MRAGAVLTLALGAALVVALGAAGQPPPGGKGGFGKKGGFGGGFGMRIAPGDLLPTAVQERLKLSDEQKKQVAELQKEVEGKLDKILTDDQRAQLKQLKERGPGGPPGRPGGPGGPPPKKGPGGSE